MKCSHKMSKFEIPRIGCSISRVTWSWTNVRVSKQEARTTSFSGCPLSEDLNETKPFEVGFVYGIAYIMMQGAPKSLRFYFFEFEIIFVFEFGFTVEGLISISMSWRYGMSKRS